MRGTFLSRCGVEALVKGSQATFITYTADCVLASRFLVCVMSMVTALSRKWAVAHRSAAEKVKKIARIQSAHS